MLRDVDTVAIVIEVVIHVNVFIHIFCIFLP